MGYTFYVASNLLPMACVNNWINKEDNPFCTSVAVHIFTIFGALCCGAGAS